MSKSISEENYLGIIFRNRDKNGTIKPGIIADRLKISNAAVTDMLKKLARRKLITYSPYKSAAFTPHGETLALQLIRRHRIWELFLKDFVGLPWENVHDEAERLEHSSSDLLIDKLEEMMNFPRTDPHGHPIPDKNGRLPKQALTHRLSDLKPGIPAMIKEVNDYDFELLKHLNQIGVCPGKSLEVIEVLPFDGSIKVKIDEKIQSISPSVSSNIFISYTTIKETENE